MVFQLVPFTSIV